MSNRRLVVILLTAFFVFVLLFFVAPRPKAESLKPSEAIAKYYKVYKADGSIIALTPSKEHPLVFFATWCPHCQKNLAGKIDPNAYYIDTFTREPDPKKSFKAIRDFIGEYHADPDLTRYFVSVDKQPQGIPYVPYVITE